MGTKTLAKKTVKRSGQPISSDGVADTMPVESIEFSTLNYRKYFRLEDLQAFAEELKIHGIISPLTVRRLDNGKYELVAGERRLRAAKIAKLLTVPVIIKDLTDDQVTEIQLAENLQRENPHPMDEARGIQLMQQKHRTIEEIAARLGKPKQFVYIRLKLLRLIEAFQEMFLADALTLQQAVEIATISQDAQQEFFDEHCTQWNTQKDFQLHDLAYYLNQYKYDLGKAPFNVKDKKLVPEAGACSSCSFNSATLKSLFPDYAKQAICSNHSCYQHKCAAQLKIAFVRAVQEHQPTALLFNGEPSAVIKEALTGFEEATNLPRYDANDITILETPTMPDKEDYTIEYSDDEPEFDKDAFEEALHEYNVELRDYEKNLDSGKYQKAVLHQSGECIAVFFSPEPPPRQAHTHTNKSISMKTVQEAMKAKTATPELLQEAMEGLIQRERRAKEIDRDKIHLSIHTQFEEKIKEVSNNEGLTTADHAAARLLVYQSLDYNSRKAVYQVLFEKYLEDVEDVRQGFFDRLVSLTDQEYSYLVRMTIACKSDSQYPHNDTGFMLYKVAEAAGINVTAIEQEQEQKAIARGKRMQDKMNELEKTIEQLKLTE